MPVTRVGGDKFAATVSVGSVALTMPGGIITGDVGLIAHGYNHTTGTPTTPSGWTAGTPVTVGASSQFITYTKTLAPADSGTTITITNTAAQRLGAVLEVYRASEFTSTTTYAQTVSSSTHTNPGATSPTDGGVSVSMIVERSSTPSTSFTQPSGYALRDTAYGTGNGSVSVGAADNLTNVASGGSLGGGSWSASTANAAIAVFMFVLENAPASPLSASGLSVLPLSGAAPLAVTATTAATGGTGSGRLYTFTWDDGETTGPQSGSTATHTYDTAGSYDVTYTVTES